MGTVEWIVLISVGVLVGLGLGFFAGRFSTRGNNRKLADVEAELETYRERVTEHFSQSAEHFQAIGRQYRELYEHMAAGSEKLCVGAPSDAQLRFPRPDEMSAESKAASAETTPAEPSEETIEAEASTPSEQVSSADPGTVAAEQEADAVPKPADAADIVEEKAADAAEEKVDIETPKAPADYASDDPKDRQYH
ncbi:MAG: DUF1043 family protein [Woeseiaceae bacterium]|nr:DUF1043 family protein [Woeseiaceae bacterium]